MNPFHLWLGLPEKSANPNHYQLLGIKSTEKDPKVIETAARQKLGLLSKVTPAANHVEAYEKIKLRIRKAHAILTDSTKRNEYDQKLTAQLAARKKKQPSTKMSAASEKGPATPAPVAPQAPPAPAAPGIPPTFSPHEQTEAPPAAAAPPAQPQTPAAPPAQAPPPGAIPVQIYVDPNTGLPVQPFQAAVPAQGAVPTQATPPANIPMAVPIQANAAPAPASAPAPNESGFSLTNEAKDGNDFGVRRKKHLRKKRNYLVPIVGLILCVAGIAALGYVVTHMEDFGMGPEDPQASTTPAESDTEPDKTPDVNTAEPEKKDPKPTKETGTDAPPAEQPPVTPPSDAGSTTKNDPKQNMADLPSAEKLDFEHLVRFRRHIEGARRAMYRRDAIVAQNEIENAKSLFLRFDSNKKVKLDSSQSNLPIVVDAAAEIKTLLTGFWQQVVTSATSISAGQTIQSGGREIGFVEGAENYVVLRIDGSNVTYNYEFLPPGLAMGVAELGAKEDLPTWRMQKAAFYAVHTHLDPKYRERAKQFANEAAKDNHDPTPIIKFVEFDPMKIGVPDQKLEPVSEEDMKEAIATVRDQFSIGRIARLRPDQIETNIDTVMESALQEKDNTVKSGGFELAYLLAVKSGDVRKVIDVIDEYSLWFEFDKSAQHAQGLIDVANEKLDERTARILVSKVIETREEIADKRLRAKVDKNAMKVAQKFQFTNLAKRLNRD